MCDHVIYYVNGSNVNKMSVIHFRFCAKIETINLYNDNKNTLVWYSIRI